MTPFMLHNSVAYTVHSGIVVLETTYNGWWSAQPFLINTIFSEFNSGAWLYDLGIFKPSGCGVTSRRRSLPRYFARKAAA